MYIEEDQEDDDEGKGDSGKGGGPILKPDLEKLLYSSPFDKKDEEEDASRSEKNAEKPTQYGSWDLYSESLILWHRDKRRKLLLEQLDTSSRITKMMVALGVQGGWDTDSMLKAIDNISHKKFKKSFYHLVSNLHESARIDWNEGRIVDPRQGHFKP